MSFRVPKLAFAIHYLSPWGGHDRSNLEILRRLIRKVPEIGICTYALEDPGQIWDEDSFQMIRVSPKFHRPALLMMAYFHLATYFFLRWLPKAKGLKPPLVHSTGTCSMVSDIVQVQFNHASWFRVLQPLQKNGTYHFNRTRGAGGLISSLFNFYFTFLIKIDRRIEKLVYSKDKIYIAIAECVKRDLEKEFGLRDNIHVIRHGVDSSLFSPAGEEKKAQEDRIAIRKRFLDEKKEEFLVLLVGEYERKGLAVAIRSLRYLPPDIRRKTKLVAIGGGSQNGFYRLAQENQVRDQVVLMGGQKDIFRYYRAADLFLLPTFYEPFGLVV